MKTQRTLIISDIHGCIEEFDELIRTVQYNPYEDKLVLVGDLMDRGPDPVGCVRRARKLQAKCVLGNHEMKYIKYKKHEDKKISNRHYHNPMNFKKEQYDQYCALDDDDWRYIRAMPSFIKVDDTYIVHAGFEPYKPIQAQHPKVMAMVRFVNDQGAMVGNLFQKVPWVHAWSERWCRTENVVYGHNVWDLKEPRIDTNDAGARCFGIDTGACYGGRLTCLILPTFEIVQVQARGVYAELKHAPD